MDQIKDYGFWIKKNALDGFLIDDLITRIQFVLKTFTKYYNISYQTSLDDIETIYNQLKAIYNVDPEKYFSFVKQNGVLSHLYEIQGLVTDSKIKEILEELNFKHISVPVGSQINLYCDFAVNPNYREGKVGIDTHQDWPQNRGSLNQVVMWVPLQNVSENNCPILFIPESHKKGFVEGNFNTNTIVPNYNENEFKPIIMDKGDVLTFSGWLVHKTGQFKNNEKIRIAITLRFNDLCDNFFISTLFHTPYNIVMNREKNQTRIPYQDEIQKLFLDNVTTKHYTDLYHKRKHWWNTIGKYIENPYEKLLQLQRFIRCNDMSKEIYEQLFVVNYLDENASVLELGGNIGRVSLVIASILNNDKNLVVIEPTIKIAEMNENNRNINCFQYNIETKILSKNKKYLVEHATESVSNKVVDYIPNDEKYTLIDCITFDQLEKKYNIKFDTLVIDCEGAFYYILLDFPEILNNINTIIIENDFDTIEHYNKVLEIFTQNNFKLIETQSSYPLGSSFSEIPYHQLFKKNV